MGDAVEDQQLAVEGIEGAQPEVTVAEELADGHVAVVHAVEQGAHDARLEHLVSGGHHPPNGTVEADVSRTVEECP